MRKTMIAVAGLAALTAAAVPTGASAQSRDGYYNGGYHWRGHNLNYRWEGAGGPIVGVGYGVYAYSPYYGLSSYQAERYFDRELYLPGCFVRTTVITDDGYASAVANTCY